MHEILDLAPSVRKKKKGSGRTGPFRHTAGQ